MDLFGHLLDDLLRPVGDRQGAQGTRTLPHPVQQLVRTVVNIRARGIGLLWEFGFALDFVEKRVMNLGGLPQVGQGLLC